LARDPCQLQRFAVDDTHMSRGVAEPYRIVGCCPVQIPTRRMALFAQLVVVVATGLYPLIWTCLFGGSAYGIDDVLDGVDGGVGTVNLLEPLAKEQQVMMRIVEPR